MLFVSLHNLNVYIFCKLNWSTVVACFILFTTLKSFSASYPSFPVTADINRLQSSSQSNLSSWQYCQTVWFGSCQIFFSVICFTVCIVMMFVQNLSSMWLRFLLLTCIRHALYWECLSDMLLISLSTWLYQMCECICLQSMTSTHLHLSWNVWQILGSKGPWKLPTEIVTITCGHICGHIFQALGFLVLTHGNNVNGCF